MDYRARITIGPDKLGGKPCIRGLPITVYEVLDYPAAGMSRDVRALQEAVREALVRMRTDTSPWPGHWCAATAPGVELGGSQRRGRIIRAGNRRMRWLLVQAAVSILRLRDPRTAALRRWAMGTAAPRGKKIAVLALARRLPGLPCAMLCDGTTYAPRFDAPRGRGARSSLGQR